MELKNYARRGIAIGLKQLWLNNAMSDILFDTMSGVKNLVWPTQTIILQGYGFSLQTNPYTLININSLGLHYFMFLLSI